jgi:hypothetical protein
LRLRISLHSQFIAIAFAVTQDPCIFAVELRDDVVASLVGEIGYELPQAVALRFVENRLTVDFDPTRR